MYVAEVSFHIKAATNRDYLREGIRYLGAAWYKNGQHLNGDWPLVESRRQFTAILHIPERSALEWRHHNRWARGWIKDLHKAGATEPRIVIRGRDPEMLAACQCKRRSSFVLFTTFAHLESPLRCGDCFSPVPLYHFRPFRCDEFADVVDWAGTYRNCDRLYIGSATGERFALRELSNIASSLTGTGRDLCRQFEKQTSKPVYYYLYRAYARSAKQEQTRLCPGCGNKWRMEKTWLRFFDFRCKRCRLVSNVAWNVR